MPEAPVLPRILLLAFLFGSGTVVARFAISQFDPRVFATLRLLIASAAFALSYMVLPSRPWPRSRKLWLQAGALGIIGPAIPTMANMSALAHMSSSLSALLTTLIPAVVVLMGHTFLKNEQLGPRKILGLLIAFAGAGALILRGETGLLDVARVDLRGYAWMGLAVVTAAASTVFGYKYHSAENYFDVACIRVFSGSAILILISGAFGSLDFSQVKMSGWLSLLYAGVVGTFLATVYAFEVLNRFGASAQSLKSYATPIVTAILGVILLGEHITPVMVASMAAIFAGISIINRHPKVPI